MLKLAVLLSGQGSTFQAFLDHPNPNVDVVCVISNVTDAMGLARAKSAGIPAHAIPHQDYPDRSAFESALIEVLKPYRPDWIVLAGFMRRLTPHFIDQYLDRILNIHPSLLPKYKGLNTYERALADKATEHGTTIHLVTPLLDNGPILAQHRLPISLNDTPDSLKAKTQAVERQLYPKAVAHIADGSIVVRDGIWLIEGKPLPPTGLPSTIFTL